MYFPVDGLLWLVVIFLLFQKCWGWHSWTFSGAELVRSRAVTLFSFIRFGETAHHSVYANSPPITALIICPPHLSNTRCCQVHFLVDLMVVKLAFLWMLLRLNICSKDYWPFCFTPDIFLIWRLSSLSWGILPEVCLFYDLLKELVSVFVRASYFQLLYRVISFCSYYFCLPPSLFLLLLFV